LVCDGRVTGHSTWSARSEHTADHNIFLQRLQTSFGVDGQALGWIRSFLTDPTQAVAFRGVTSNCISLRYGVPQGSVLLGSLLFLLYTADVGAVAQIHGVSMHSYADDTQLYASCPAIDASTSGARLLRCIEDVDRWMSSNRLKAECPQNPVNLAGISGTAGEGRQYPTDGWWR
jgi:Reverse transcriptase (RNA-dependent DNA polymerase)